MVAYDLNERITHLRLIINGHKEAQKYALTREGWQVIGAIIAKYEHDLQRLEQERDNANTITGVDAQGQSGDV